LAVETPVGSEDRLPESKSTFVDLHCHVLPGVDDGPAELPAAVELVRSLATLGFEELHPTPHQRLGLFVPERELVLSAAASLRSGLAEAGCGSTIREPAAENMWDDLFLSRLTMGGEGLSTYAGGRAYLLELPVEATPPGLGRVLFESRMAGRLPVLAHVERYPDLCGKLARLEEVSRTAAILFNLSSLAGRGSFFRRRLLRRLIEAGLVHAAASDAHGPDDVVYCEAGVEWLRSKLGEGTVHRLLVENPRIILAGELPSG
jgi:protein-tyrosine phosphatase